MRECILSDELIVGLGVYQRALGDAVFWNLRSEFRVVYCSVNRLPKATDCAGWRSYCRVIRLRSMLVFSFSIGGLM